MSEADFWWCSAINGLKAALPMFDADDGRCSSNGLEGCSLAAELGGDCLEFEIVVAGVVVVAVDVGASFGRHGDVARLERLLLIAVAPRPTTVAAFPMAEPCVSAGEVTCSVSMPPSAARRGPLSLLVLVAPGSGDAIMGSGAARLDSARLCHWRAFALARDPLSTE